MIDDGSDIDLEGGPDAPFRPGGTPRREFHARLMDALSDVTDGRPWWRAPEDRLMSHLFGEHRDRHHVRNWTRGYDDPLVRSSGGHHFGYTPTGGPVDYGEDYDHIFSEHLIAVDGRAVVDTDGFRIDVLDDEERRAIYMAFDPWDLEEHTPPHIRLWELDADSYRRHLLAGSVVRGHVDELLEGDIDETTAWALCAFSLPDLVPMPDRIVSGLLGLRADEDAKPYWWWALRTDPDAVRRLESLRDASGEKHLSLLRLAELLVLVRESDLRHTVPADLDVPF